MAGALVFSDSRLFAFPVASFYGTFAYVTCPLAVRRLARDLAAAGMVACPDIGELEQELTDSRAWITTGSVLTTSGPGDGKAQSVHSSPHWEDESTSPLFLDEFECRAKNSDELDLLAAWVGERILQTTCLVVCLKNV